ncbi:MAG: cobaltochelatase subunit CobN [Acidobacteria bacterium]|nr:cobaltochelatase subunit CobN [Acidobacteriota bacterium]
MTPTTEPTRTRAIRRRLAELWSHRKRIAAALLAAAVLGSGFVAYQHYLAVTRVAFVNFPGFQLARIERARQSGAVRVEALDMAALDRAAGYPVVYVFGRGLQLDEAQLAHLREAGRRGTRLFVQGATNPALDVTNLRGPQLDAANAYLEFGGAENYARLLNFSRAELDGKAFRADPVQPPVERSMDVLFHLDDDLTFETVDAFDDYYDAQGLAKADAPTIALLTSVPGPFNANRDHVDAFIRALEGRAWNVYPLAATEKRLDFLRQIEPDLVVLMPHGRLTLGRADEAISWLRERDIPMLTPLSVFQNHDDWATDQQGMAGALLTMSVVLPELDGGIAPYAVAAQFTDADGYEIFDALPERLETFCDLVERWLALKAKPNRDKRVAIYYYKGPGKNAMNAGSMEVAPSLLNLLRSLRDAGYTVEGLPETDDEFWELVQTKGPVLGPYARGAFEEFVAAGEPALVPAGEYAAWLAEDLEPGMRDAVVEQYGPAPGEYMTVGEGEETALAVARVEFGNVVILPQPLPGAGDDTFRLVHGARKAPPHPYVASYLWTRNAFGADAVMHFGTHGSLEFTPWKQIALSTFDWSDALVGGLPHVYVYVMSNVGEGIIAKRRSYATTVTHLTPPFMEGGLYEGLRPLRDRLDSYRNAADGPVRAEHARTIRRLAAEMNLHVDLGLDPDAAWSADEMFRLSNHVETIDGEKVAQGLYTLGSAFTATEVDSTAELMAIDPIAYALARIDTVKGAVEADDLEDEVFFDRRYRQRARGAYARRVAGRDAEAVLADLVADADRQHARAWREAARRPSDDDIIRGFISMGTGSRNRPKATASKARAGELEDLVARILPHPRKVEFVERLQSEQEFARTSQLLDPVQRERARTIAAVIPPMAEAIEIAEDPDVFALLEAMQDGALRERTFALLKDPGLVDRVEEEKRRLAAERLALALDAPQVEALERAWRHESAKGLAAAASEDIGRTLSAVAFYREHRATLDGQLRGVDKPAADRLRKILDDAAFDRRLDAAVGAAEVELEERAARDAELARAVLTLEASVTGIDRHRDGLRDSSDLELGSVARALAGGYVDPSPGGDPIVNPDAVPTGRNLFSIDAEKTPSPEAWAVGRRLAEALLEEHRSRHDAYPRKVAFTLWPSDFIGTEGATIGQIFYLLGVEPVWDPFGRVADLRLMPAADLGRPRIDVVVQTAGQLRDLAASRLALINRAVAMAAEARDADAHANFVQAGRLRAEEVMKEKGLSPADARRYSTLRVFGGVNGNYGTAIMEMVERGDRWEDDAEVAGQYLRNMGAVYDEGELWSFYAEGIFEAALADTEIVVQPRESHTWGALSLDHVYEFMGGLSMAVRHVTGRDADAYFNDFRNAQRPRVTDLTETVWTEARSTLLNPAYISELQEGGASSAGQFAETFRNTYGWNVMKPAAIDDALWNELYEVYVDDRHDLGVEAFFRRENPYALQEMTAVMLETVRKGLWDATAEQVAVLAELHTRLVEEFEAGCSGFVCDNAALASFIAEQAPADLAAAYRSELQRNLTSSVELTEASVVLAEQDAEPRPADAAASGPSPARAAWLGAVLVAALFAVALLVLRRRRTT